MLDGLREAAYVRFYVKEGETLPAEIAEIVRDHEVTRILTDDQDWLHKLSLIHI